MQMTFGGRVLAGLSTTFALSVSACGLIAGVGDVRLATDAGTDAAAIPCVKPHGRPMVRVKATGGDFCIDTEVVTVADFNEFLIADGEPFDVPPSCDAQKGKRPARDDKTDAALPARGMLWCYAWAYCKWAGKRLCGAIGGGEVPFDAADPKSEWTYACANGKLNYTYPYGSSYDAAACNTERTRGDPPVPTGTFPRCHGVAEPFASLFDMSGNTPEYDAYLHGDTVRQRGGGLDARSGATCAAAEAFSNISAPDETSVRCCADP